MRNRGTIALATLLLLVPTGLALGQAKIRPGDERPELEDFAPEEAAPPPLALPPIPAPTTEDQLASTGRVFIKGFRVTGNTVFSLQELEGQLAPYAGRAITSEELLAARDSITQLYISRGYITSGAVIPDQKLRDGVVTLQVIEGTLRDVRVEGTESFRPHYFKSRLLRVGRAPLNVLDVEEELRILQQSPWVKGVRAALQPGAQRGEAVLHLAVEEAQPYDLWLEYGNTQSAPIGSDGGGPTGRVANLAGLGDVLRISYDRTRGLNDLDTRYSIPVDSHNTIVDLRYRRSESDVVSGDFKALDLHSRYVSYTAEVRTPIYRTAFQELWLGFAGEWHRASTYIFDDERISIALGADDGRSTVSVLRVPLQWTLRTPTQVFAARSTVSFGLDVLGASDEASQPDGEFVSWLGQFQYAQRFPERFRGSELVTRFDIQITDSRLLSIEKFALGGMRTVRGYHENELVRDNGLVGSVELRVPVWRDDLGRSVLQLVPFADIGQSWNKGGTYRAPGLEQVGDEERIKTLSSLGLGMRYAPTARILAEIYWGGALRDVPDRGSSLQNHGWSFQITARTF